MIYTVEIDFTSPDHFDEWSAWYNGNLPVILTVPGVETAQRLEAVTEGSPRFLAIYTISDPDVFTSDAYLAIGGGGTASSRWKDYIKRRRNLYAGLESIPAIGPSALLGVLDSDPLRLDPPDLLFVPLTAQALAMSPARRYLTVLHDSSRVAEFTRRLPGVAFYRPLAERQTSERFGRN